MTSSVYSEAYAGSGGIVSIGAQVAVVNDTSNQIAFIDANTQIRSADTVTVSATGNRAINSKVAGGAVGGVVAGAAISRATGTGSTLASVGDGVQVGKTSGSTVRQVFVSADNSTSASTYALGVAAGCYAAVGQEATTKVTPVVNATVGNNVAMTLTGDMSVKANSTPEVSATAIGSAISTTVAVGVSLPKITLSPTVNATIGTSFNLNATAILLPTDPFLIVPLR
jgi:hypothetical protein